MIVCKCNVLDTYSIFNSIEMTNKTELTFDEKYNTSAIFILSFKT